MNRKEFLRTSLLGVAALAVSPALAASPAGAATIEKRRGRAATGLKISFQESTAPGGTLAEKLDWMEAHGVVGLEPWGAKLWERTDEIRGLLAGRNVKVSAVCAGFDGFILAEDGVVKASFDRTMRLIVSAAAELGSVGVVMVPAFNRQIPCRPHTLETREFLVEELARLGDYAAECGTSVILEPLNRREAFYLRQIADAAAICRDTGSKGVRCMGDFWHMSEETSDYGALRSGGEYLVHVHVAGRSNRTMPGEEGTADDYTDGFRALKEMGYGGYVSFECGTRGDRRATVAAALELLRTQWKKA